jgi:serine/threonine protein kinase
MALKIGARLGSYQITALIGAGGMGEVYRAADSKLKRDVAIKILPENFYNESGQTDYYERESSYRPLSLAYVGMNITHTDLLLLSVF